MKALALAAALMLTASPALAAMACGPRADLVKKLKAKYGEHQTALGISGPLAVEVWTNPKTGTWTMLRTMANGVSCLMATGEHWQAVPVEGEES